MKLFLDGSFYRALTFIVMAPTSTPTPITWLRYFRIAAGMTLEALEDASGVSLVSLSRIENQRVTPLPETRVKIAAVFNMPPDLVFPPAGNRTPMDVLDGWVLECLAERSDFVIDFAAIPPRSQRTKT